MYKKSGSPLIRKTFILNPKLQEEILQLHQEIEKLKDHIMINNNAVKQS